LILNLFPLKFWNLSLEFLVVVDPEHVKIVNFRAYHSS
jgi:hypothetical protein